MATIESRLSKLEQKTKARRQSREYCIDHAPPPIVIFNGKTKPDTPPQTICDICGKPYKAKPVVITFDAPTPPPSPQD